VYLMRNVHVTGAIFIHEIALSGEEYWCVNTSFSCLCTLDQAHSFVPALATAVHHRVRARGSVPPERSRATEWSPAVRYCVR